MPRTNLPVNNVKVYGNGLGIITKRGALTEKRAEVAIPVQQDILDAVISSLQVYGEVAFVEPPSFTPKGLDVKNLVLDPKDIGKSVVTTCVGAKVKIGCFTASPPKVLVGTLMGIEETTQSTPAGLKTDYSVQVFCDGGKIRKVKAESIESFEFLDPAMRHEVEKALQANFQKIKPQIKMVRFSLEGEGSQEFAYQYNTVLPAWKVRYLLSQNVGKKWNISAQAIVDNNTDDCWEKTYITVVTGQPLNFGTDVATIRIPQRQMVNLVADKTLGPVIAVASRATKGGGGMLRMASFAGGTAMDFTDDDGPESVYGAAAVPTPIPTPITAPEAEILEVGDSCEYRSETPLTIQPQTSAIVHMFARDVEGEVILLYQGKSSVDRPFRAVRFKNTTGNVLGRGVCEISQDSVYQGKALLETTPKNDTTFVIHALETGVKVFRDKGKAETKVQRISIAKALYTEHRLYRWTSIYSIDNSKNEVFPFELEHVRSGNNSDFEVWVEEKPSQDYLKTNDGIRVSFKLPALTTVEIRIVETCPGKQETTIYNGSWFEANSESYGLLKNEDVTRCLELQNDIEDSQEQERELAEQIQKNNAQIEQIGRMIASADKYQDAYAEERHQCYETQKKLAVLLAEIQKARVEKTAEMQDVLRRIKFVWEDGASTKPAVKK